MNSLIGARRFLSRADVSADGREIHHRGGRGADAFYRERWSHDRVVRSTHGVNCTGSCSWQIYVKDGIITWEAQQTDYPSTGPDRAEYEPRGCPRGAAFSWYTYSPTRVRYPYVRAVLLDMFREAKRACGGDPVDAWGSIVEDPDRARRYKSARGRGGLVRATWDEAAEMIAAAYVYTTKTYGPDRTVGFTPIPAMSIVSFASGARFHQLIGGAMLSFYDWYADLPVASPQVFGDQTDVPESGDWWDAGYLIMWGSNLPLTRTPDAHWMVEARYRGQKVIAVSPDYADNVKFADEWVAPRPGTDGALALAMGHVILREFYENPDGQKRPEYFQRYASTYTDLPFLVQLDEAPDGSGAAVPGKFLTAEDLPEDPEHGTEHQAFKPALWDATTGGPRVPQGTLGHRYAEDGEGRWNLELGDAVPQLSLLEGADGACELVLPRFDAVSSPAEDAERARTTAPGTMRRGVPYRVIDGRRVTTVYDLLLAAYGIAREGLPGVWPSGYDDASEVGTPAWQETITGVSAAQCARIGREYAANAVESNGRSMIVMGAGTNHWFHSDTIYRTFLTLTTLTGGQGVNGGGWAHYVGQEKVRPITGWLHLANALDWSRPPRHQTQTSYWFLHTDQWRYDNFSAAQFTAATAEGRLEGMSNADVVAMANRLGWMPHFPQFDQNPLALTQAADAEGRSVQDFIVEHLKSGKLRFAAEDPDAGNNHPRILSLWRANLLGSSAKGTEYFIKHLLGTKNDVRAAETPEGRRPRDVRWREDAPKGKLDLLLSLDFRMTSSTLLSDVVLPAATWYEKYDLSTTDMHPFVHAFNPAIAPPWQARSDWDTWKTIAEKFSELAETHLGTQRDVVTLTLLHDTPDELAYPHGVVRDWKHDEGVEPIPGVTMPKLVEVERDYTKIGEKYAALGPLAEKLGFTTKGLTFDVRREVEYLGKKNGLVTNGIGAGRPKLETDVQAAEMVLTFSGTTNGHLATQGFETLEKRTGRKLADLSAEQEGKQITFADTQVAPVPVITSPEWSGSETGGRRYSCFTINTERLKPWHTLTGRQHFYLDHDWMREMGENLPVYRPPLDMDALFDEGEIGSQNDLGLAVRYLTPHNKWSIHSEYQDNLFMLSLSRGGQTIWMSDRDAAKAGIRDNDWVEAVNRNGVVAARAVVSHRMPEGTVYMHHAQDRVVNTPLTETSGKRGGTHNSLTRIMIKPSHMIGGYAQQSFFFNYLGPTGNNRDEVTRIRKRTTEVQYR
ncbi:MAG: nitrate reductase subunit alpha [Brachybacterium sp.]|nr:nitrate reductase subunit alpha [Brachybacterium sp.]